MAEFPNEAAAEATEPETAFQPTPLQKFWQWICHYAGWLPVGLTVLAVAGWGAGIYFAFFDAAADGMLTLAIAFLALTFTVAAGLAFQRDRQSLLVLGWGTYLSLLLFAQSNAWLWELNEAYPVKPVAEMVQQYTTKGDRIYTTYPYHRPSLNFYSDRKVIPAREGQQKEQMLSSWQQGVPMYLLVQPGDRQALNLSPATLLGEAAGWQLIVRDNHISAN